jgi:hypothetical protein
MKKQFQLASVIIFLTFNQSFAQLYTDEVQVMEGLGGKVGVRMVPQTANFEVLLTGSETAGRKLLANGMGLRLQRFGDSGGVTMRYGFLSHDGLTDFGGFGGYLNGSGLNYYFVGEDYQSPITTFLPGGTVGIGTNNPSAKLQITSETERETFRIYKSGNNTKYLSIWQGVGGSAIDPIGSGLLYLGYDQSTNVIVGNGGGNLGIGTSIPSSNIDVVARPNASAEIRLRQPNEQSGWGIVLGQSTTLEGYLAASGRNLSIMCGWDKILTIGAPEMNNYSSAKILIPGGNVGIGMDPTQKLSVNGNASKSSAGDWVANSDARLKKKIIQLSSSETLDKLLKLRGVTYEWDDDKTGINRPLGIQYGFTAQNIQEVFPELVEEDNLGYLQTAYGTYDAMMIEALRALNEKITTLEKENEMLKQANIDLRKSDEVQQASIDKLQREMQDLAALLTRTQSKENTLTKTSQR